MPLILNSAYPCPWLAADVALAAYEVGEPARARTGYHDDFLTHGDGMVIGFARLGHERRFVHEQAPRVVGADLIAAAGDADDAAAVCELEFAIRHLAQTFGEGVGFPQFGFLAFIQGL